MSDLAQSVAVFVGGLCIWWKPQYHIIDPILTLLFCVLVLYNAFGVLRSSVAVLLEEIPSNVDWKEVYDAISAIPNVEDVHDLHIWSISHGEAALSVHCTSPDPHALIKVTRACARFGIKHATIQIQPKEGPCPSCQNDCCTSHLSSSDEY
jgi:cation diffusion facilitator family transporter